MYSSLLNLLILLFLQIVIVHSQQRTGAINDTENAILQNTCGRPLKSFHKGMNSVNVSIIDAPWVISITEKEGSLCAGTLISSRHIVTAAHCITRKEKPKVVVENGERILQMQFDTFDPKELEVLLGDECTRRKRRKNCRTNTAGRQRFTRGLRAWAYSGYEEVDHSDIVIIELEFDIHTLKPICLSTAFPKEHQPMEVFGFGMERHMSHLQYDRRLDILQKIYTKVVDCRIESEEVRLMDREERIDDFCTRARDKSHPCPGDSGGGVTWRNPKTGVYYFTGISSTGYGCVHHEYPEYTFVDNNVAISPFAGWICTKTGVCAPGYAHMSRLESDKRGALIDRSKVVKISCDSEMRVFSVYGTKTLCYFTFIPEVMKFNTSSAREQCKEWDASLAPVRNDMELKAVLEYEKKFGSGLRFPKVNPRMIVDAEWSEKYKEFRWSKDNSIVRKDRKYWLNGKVEPVDEFGREAKCLSIKWISARELRHEPITCGHEESAIVCAKRPKVTTEYRKPLS